MGDVLARLQSALGDAYRIEKELGRGGMSRVFLAEERELERQVVVKVLPPEMAAGVGAERFRREIQGKRGALCRKGVLPKVLPNRSDFCLKLGSRVRLLPM